MQKKLILGVTLGGSSRLLDGQANYFRELGYDVYLISEAHYKESIFCDKEGVSHLPVDIVADINLVRDFKVLVQIIKHFIRVRPDIVNVGTPKMGLLGILAATLLRIDSRIYTCRGLRFETESGIKRKILTLMEKITVRLAKSVIYVSPSLLEAAISYGVADSNKAIVIKPGSSNGVDVAAFNKTQINQQEREILVQHYNLKDKIVIGFVGRVTLHKGAYELVASFEKLYKENNELRLILMGHIKCDDDFQQKFSDHPGIISIPFQDNVALYMSLFDIFVLPSWREGFPNVPIQAAAMGLPVVVSDATGCVDSVINDWNGKVFKLRSVDSLTAALKFYIDDPVIRIKHGSNGVKWSKNFKNQTIWDGIDQVYQSFV